jgi:hypothetical protein
MTFTITYAWWWIPASITVLGLGYLVIPKDYGSSNQDIEAGINALLVFTVILPAWAVAGILK